MHMGHKLASVSMIALATALNVTGTAHADSVYNAVVDWSAETVTIAAGSSSKTINSDQNNDNTHPVAAVTTSVIGNTKVGTKDYNGLVAVTVDDNSISALAVLNTVVTYDDVSLPVVDPLHLDPLTWNSIDMWTATGSGAASAATLASLQSSDNGASLKSSVNTSEIRAAGSDLFAGSRQDLTDNTILSQAIGNEAINTISGDINPLLSSTEAGFTGISGGPTLGNPSTGNSVGASATALVASVQENSLANSFSTVDDTRIGSLVLALDTTTTIENTKLTVTGNTIEATITGNSAVNQVNLDDALDTKHTSASIFNGSAGVASEQRNTIAGRTFLVQVSKSDIEAGFSETTPIANLTGSTIDFSDNRLAATGTGNTANNLVRLGDGINQNGTFPTGGITLTRSSTVLIAGDGTDGNTNVIGDLFIGNHQFSQLEINAVVGGIIPGDPQDGDLNVLVESLQTSKVEAAGNSIVAGATGNNVANTIEVAGATSLDSLVSLGNAQLLTDGSSSSATVKGDIFVSAATLGTVKGDIVSSSLSAHDNSILADASGNIAANSIGLDGNTITGTAVNPQFNFVQSTHTTMESRVAADFGIVSGQFNREGEYKAQTIGAITVEAANVQGVAGSTIFNSKISASDNSITAQSIANRVTKNSFTVAGDGLASSFSGTVGVISTQVAEGSDTKSTDHLTMTATVLNGDDPLNNVLVFVNATARTTDKSDIRADGNQVSANVIGNLVDAKANAINIKAVSVSDGVPSPTDQSSTPVATVYRSLADAVIPNATPDSLPDTVVQGGFVLVNDQSVENTGSDADQLPFSAYVEGSINVQVGSTDLLATLTNTDISASLNSITAATAGNQAGNSLKIDALTLDATTTLVNTQTFSDEDGGNGSYSGGLDSSMVSTVILLQASAGTTTMSDIDARANDNLLQSSARINTATNNVVVSANSQTVVDVVTGNDVNVIEMGSVPLAGFTAGNTLLRSETGLLNSQEFGDLINVGVHAFSNGTFVLNTIDSQGGSLADSTVAADWNRISALALGNDAANTLTLDVGRFDLSEAGSTSAANGPLGIIANHQRGRGSPGGFTVGMPIVAVQASVASVDTKVSGSDITADRNRISALGRVNNATNVLDVSGTAYVEAVTTTPSVRILDVAANTELTADDLAFGIASFQVNGLSVSADTVLASVFVDASNVPLIDDTDVSASLNAIVAEARGNDIVNDATLDFGTNSLSGFVANLQQTTEDGTSLSASIATASILAATSVTGTQSVTDSHFAVDDNAIAALVSANRATNIATATGTNLYSGTGLAAPSAAINPAGASDVTVLADLSVVNVQGAEAILSDQDDLLNAIVALNSVSASVDIFDSGTASVENNLIVGDATIHSAVNTATLDAETNVGSLGNTASASVVSQQTVTSDSSATGDALTDTINATVADPSDARAVSVSLKANTISGKAMGGSASNRLNVLADAAILGGTPAAAPAFTASTLTLNADFSVMNLQSGATYISAQNMDGAIIADIGLNGVTILNNDSISLQDNAIQGKTTGFTASNILVLDAGSSSDATGQVGNRQAIVAGSEIRSAAVAARLRSSFTAGASGSRIVTSNNEVTSVSAGNTALNAVQSSAGASLQESSGAGSAINAATGITVTGADYGVLNWQSTTSSAVSASVNGAVVGVDGLGGTQGVNNSAVAVNGNRTLAQATGNSAVNSLELNSGTFRHPSASISSLQTNNATVVSADVQGVTVGIGLTGPVIGGGSNNSSFTVRGNEIGATAIGNSGINRITAD